MSRFTLSERESKFTFRITGKQSVDRLTPLIDELGIQTVDLSNNIESIHNITPTFIWETTCEKTLRNNHRSGVIVNKLHNTQVIESKSCFAFLQLNMQHDNLDTFVANNAKEVKIWASKHWQANDSRTVSAPPPGGDDEEEERDWWAVKASNGNGGKDIWIVNKSNHLQSLGELPANDEYVIQRYVHRPLLCRGRKKFHFRCYSLLRGDMSALVYRDAFVLTAGMDFDYCDHDPRRHVTNLSVNKRFADHPGQIPCDLKEEYPQVYEQLRAIWRGVAQAAEPFMRHQASSLHFEFFGLDLIADQSGRCWLIEANRLPGLESSDNNRAQEDRLYDEMMRSLLQIVLRPVLRPATATTATTTATTAATTATTTGIDNSADGELDSTPRGRLVDSVDALNAEYSAVKGRWDFVKGRSATFRQDCGLLLPEDVSTEDPSAVPGADQQQQSVDGAKITGGGSSATWRNLFNWRAFTKKNRHRVMVQLLS